MSNYIVTVTSREVMPQEQYLGGIDQPQCSELSFQTDDLNAALTVANQWLTTVKPTYYPTSSEPTSEPETTE